jgi:hypothetical protein
MFFDGGYINLKTGVRSRLAPEIDRRCVPAYVHQRSVDVIICMLDRGVAAWKDSMESTGTKRRKMPTCVKHTSSIEASLQLDVSCVLPEIVPVADVPASPIDELNATGRASDQVSRGCGRHSAPHLEYHVAR